MSDKVRERLEKYSYDHAERILEECDSRELSYVCYDDEEYPKRLKDIASPPAMLFYRGSLDALSGKLIAVTGAREACEKSLEICDRLCSDLVKNDVTLMSGFAGGVDQQVNSVCIREGAATVAVLAGPVDEDQPKGSNDLKREVWEKGIVISEYYPGSKRNIRSFVDRNRISVGLSDGVLFIEASPESHGLDNYSQAVYQGKPVFVVPPMDIFDERFAGQSMLLRRGCVGVYGAEDILRVLSEDQQCEVLSQPWLYTSQAKTSVRKTEKSTKAVSEKKVKGTNIPKYEKPPRPPYDPKEWGENNARLYEIISKKPTSVDELTRMTGIPTFDVLAELMTLELEGYVKSLPGRIYTV